MAKRPRATSPTAPTPGASMLYQPYAIETVIGILSRLPDPDLVLKQLGMGRHELRKLETDDEITATLETRREAVIATPWRLEPFEGEPAEWLSNTLTDHMEALLRGAWSAVPYGYAVQEVIYRQEGPRIGLDHITEVPLEWFEPRHDGTLIYTPPDGGTPHAVDTELKFLLTRRNPSYRNPFGEALLSRAYWPWFFRHNGWRFWINFVERFAEPLLLGKIAAHDPAAAQQFVAALQSQGYNSVVAVPVVDGVGDIAAVTQAASGEFSRVEQALLARIQRLILGQTLTSQVGDSGSYAAAKVHNEVRDDKRRADIRLVTHTAQQVVNALWTLNRFPGESPGFILQDDTGLELDRAERDKKLAEAGIVRFTEQYILDAYDLTEEHFTIPETPAAVPPPVAPARAPTSASARPADHFLAANGQRFTPDQELVEGLIDRALGQAASPIPAELIARTIRASESPSDLAERLAGLYAGQDAAAFRELMERSLFAADVLGYVTAERRIGALPEPE